MSPPCPNPAVAGVDQGVSGPVRDRHGRVLQVAEGAIAGETPADIHEHHRAADAVEFPASRSGAQGGLRKRHAALQAEGVSPDKPATPSTSSFKSWASPSANRCVQSSLTSVGWVILPWANATQSSTHWPPMSARRGNVTKRRLLLDLPALRFVAGREVTPRSHTFQAVNLNPVARLHHDQRNSSGRCTHFPIQRTVITAAKWLVLHAQCLCY